MSLTGIAACNCVLLPNVVVRSLPFQRTVELAIKPEPVTVSVNAFPPAFVLVGASELMDGTGFGFDPEPPVCGLLFPPPPQANSKSREGPTTAIANLCGHMTSPPLVRFTSTFVYCT